MSIFDRVPALTDFSNYEQSELKKNARLSMGQVLKDDIACRCFSKGNDKMVVCSIDWRERSTLSLLDKDIVVLQDTPCSC